MLFFAFAQREMKNSPTGTISGMKSRAFFKQDEVRFISRIISGQPSLVHENKNFQLVPYWWGIPVGLAALVGQFFISLRWTNVSMQTQPKLLKKIIIHSAGTKKEKLNNRRLFIEIQSFEMSKFASSIQLSFPAPVVESRVIRHLKNALLYCYERLFFMHSPPPTRVNHLAISMYIVSNLR